MKTDKPLFSDNNPEPLLYGGQDPSSSFTGARFKDEAVGRGKMLLALIAVKQQMTPEIHGSWSPGSSTAVETSEGRFDATVCTVAKHFDKHGSRYGDVRSYTQAGLKYWEQHGRAAAWDEEKKCMWLPHGQFTRSGKILTFAYANSAGQLPE